MFYKHVGNKINIIEIHFYCFLNSNDDQFIQKAVTSYPIVVVFERNHEPNNII